MDITTHPFLNIMWTFFVIFVWISWFWLLITIVVDVFRRHDIGGFMKAVWLVVLVFLPLIGVIVYLITQSRSMAERDQDRVQQQQAQFDSYVRDTAGTAGPAADIERAKALLDNGTIDEAEFARLKAKALA
jgi:predicted PurR-regulated permease PerM